MKQAKQQTSLSRRKFLRNAAVAGGAAAAASAAPGIATAETEATSPTATESGRDGYRLTQHIIDYYKSAAS